MNTYLADCLDRYGIAFVAVSKSAKVKLLARWAAEFSGLLARARLGHSAPDVLVDNDAQEQLRACNACSFYVLPDDDSGMPSVLCRHTSVPDLAVLVSDTLTKCDEIVIVDAEFGWSCVLVNHGAAGVGRYYMRSGAPR